MGKVYLQCRSECGEDGHHVAAPGTSHRPYQTSPSILCSTII